MHELSLARAVADVVASHAAGRRVSRVTLQVGHLRQVVPSTLEFCWKVVVDGTPLAGAEIEIEHVPAVGSCPDCGRLSTLEHPVLVCPACEGRNVVLVSGEEFLVASMDLVAAGQVA